MTGNSPFSLSLRRSETNVIADGRGRTDCVLDFATGLAQANGAAERTVQQVRRMARVFLAHVREKTGSVFPSSSPWWAWALRHAAWTYNRFHVRVDTRTTPYSKTRLKVYAQTGAHLQERHTKFLYGCWLGRDSPTDKHTVESKAGVFRTRAVRRLTEVECTTVDVTMFVS